MDATTKEPNVEIVVIWNPNTLNLDIKFNGAQAVHVIGVLSFAAHVLGAKLLEPPAIVHAPILPHLVKQ